MTTATEVHPLDALAKGDPKNLIALLLWKGRHRNPEMSVLIDENDIKGLTECAEYLKAKPGVLVKRLTQRPAVVVSLVQDGTENAIRAVENNEQDYEKGQLAKRVAKAAEQAPDLAARIVNQASTGDVSLSDIRDAAEALQLLARAAKGA